jgi:hypothetical protein
MLIPAWGMIGIWTDKIGLDLTYSFIFLSNNDLCILCRFHNAWEFWAYSVVSGLVVGPNYSISQTMMGELTPPGFEYMVGVTCSSSSSAICSQKTTVFRFIWTVESLRSNYWTECDPGRSRQERKQLEGLPGPVCFQRSCMSRGVVRRECAEREGRSSTVGLGEARDDRLYGREG